jgi:DNA (cytosine-5)-methyltransferase 1
LPAVAHCLNAGGMGRQDYETETLIPTRGGFFGEAHAFDARQSDVIQYGDKTGPLDTDGHSVAVAFKASHFTRGKDGAPSATAPPLSADADKGDQDTLIAFSVKDHGADAGQLAPTLRAGGFDKSHANGGVMPAIAFAIQAGAIKENPNHGPDGVGVRGDDAAYTLEARSEVQAVAFESRFARNGRGAPNTIVPPLKAQSGETGKGDAAPLVAGPDMMVRRLTPRECERLMGFPDDYTLTTYRGKAAADGPRYKALGNSMAVPVMAWIGRRIQMVESLSRAADAAMRADGALAEE